MMNLMLCGTYEARLGNGKEASLEKMIRSHEVGVTTMFNTRNYFKVEKKCLGPPTPILYFILYYYIFTFRRYICTHAAKGQQVMPRKEAHQEWIEREKQGMYQREAAEIFHKILQESPNAWITRDIPTSWGNLPLTKVGCTQ